MRTKLEAIGMVKQAKRVMVYVRFNPYYGDYVRVSKTKIIDALNESNIEEVDIRFNDYGDAIIN